MASYFAVGLPFTFDGVTNHFATTTGGTATVANPTTADTVTFDGLSGTGICTFTANLNCSTFTVSSANVTIKPQTQTITCAGTGTVWTFIATATFTSGTSTILLTGTNATFAGGNISTYDTLSITGSGTAVLGGTSTFATLSRVGTAVKTDGLTLNANQTATNLTLSGNSLTNRLLVQSNTIGTTRTITVTNAPTLTNADFVDITGAGAAAPFTGTSLGNGAGNSGITFTTPASQTWSGNTTGSWSTAANWTTRVPLPQDNVAIPGLTSATLTADMPRLGANIDFTGSTGGSFVYGNAFTMYGNLTYVPLVTVTPSGLGITLGGRGAQTLTSATKVIGSPTISADGGSYTLQDALSIGTNSINLNGGTLDANGFNVTAGSLIATTSRTAVLNMGTGTWSMGGTTNVWNVSNASLTINASTSTILVTNTGTTTKAFIGGGKAYYNVIFRQPLDSALNSVTGANTYSSLIYRDGRMANNNYAFVGAGDGMSVSEKIR